MTTIGQLTDIHVAAFSDLRVRDAFNKRATGWVNYTRKRKAEYGREVVEACIAALVDARPDLVVVTGDLSNLALRSEWIAARDLLTPLVEAGIRYTVIPGNHDTYLAQALGGDFEQVFAPALVADAREATPYPYVVRVGATSVVHVNSGIPTPPMLAFGRVGPEQLRAIRHLAAEEQAAGQTLVVAVHHHPTRAPHKTREWPRGMHDAPAFRALCRELGVALVMHGHNHVFHARRMRRSETVVVGCSSSTTRRQSPETHRGQTLLYTIDDAPTAQRLVRLQSRDWTRDGLGPWTDHAVARIPEETAHEALDHAGTR